MAPQSDLKKEQQAVLSGLTLPSICDALGSMPSTVTGTRQKIVPIQNGIRIAALNVDSTNLL